MSVQQQPWPEVSLGDICQFHYGRALKASERSGEGYAVFGSNGQVGRHLEALTEGPTLIVGRKGSLGEVWYSEEACWPIDTTYFVQSQSTAADLRWLYHCLRQLPLKTLNRAAAIPGLNRADAYKLSLRLPPLGEQRRIANMLDRACALRSTRRESLALFDSLTESIFLDMFGGSRQSPIDLGDRLEDHPRGWSWQPLGQLADLTTGHTPDRTRPEYWNGGVPWVNLTEIRALDGQVATTTELQVSEDGIRNSSAVLHPAGTVCFSRTASIGFVTVMGVPMATSQDFVNWICGDQLDPIYLMHALLRSRARLRSLSSGSTHRTIYMRVAEQFRVLAPPIDLQQQFAAQVAKLAGAREIASRSADQLGELFASLQQRAFRGEL